MSIFLTIKIINFAKSSIMLVVATIAFSTSAQAQKNTVLPDNIVIVKKQVYSDPVNTAQKTQAYQKICTTLKEGSYATTKLPPLAPKEGDYLSLDEISKFHNVTVTEYLSGSNYARYEEGQTWNFSIGKEEKERLGETEFYCRMVPQKFIMGEIRTKTQLITFGKYGDKEGVVTVYSKPEGLSSFIKLPKMLPDLLPQKIRNSNIECLSRPDIPDCYLKDMPVHIGSKKQVVVETKRPARGTSKLMDAMGDMVLPIDGRLAGNVVFKALDFLMIYENVSVSVGKEIPNSKFEIPEFAKNYKMVKK